MAKFTVYFKDKALSSEIFDSGIVHIGRDETNDVTVDSLAIAPAHAVVVIKENGCVIKQLNDDFPLIINNQPSKESILNNGDRINIGKHSIAFSVTESIANLSNSAVNNKTLDSLNEQIEDKLPKLEASLQVMNGHHIGRILTLKKTMTRIGNTGSGIAVISRRKDGYYVAALENTEQMTVNNEPLGEKSVKLNNNDIITVNNTSMQFYSQN